MSSLFAYHELRDREPKVRKRMAPGAAEGLTELIRGLVPYTQRQMTEFVRVSPNPADRAARRLCHAYRAGTDEVRRFLRTRITEVRGWILLTFSQRSAVHGRHTRKSGPI